MSYLLKNNYWCGADREFSTITKALEVNRVLNIIRCDNGSFILEEGCDEHFSVALTPEQLAAFGKELIDMANEGSRNEL